MGAGGATALAQAAAQSKQGISASIEQQETQNQKLRAQGEQTLQQQNSMQKNLEYKSRSSSLKMVEYNSYKVEVRKLCLMLKKTEILWN